MKETIKETIFEINKIAMDYWHNNLICIKTKEGKDAYKYLMDRGITREDILSWDIGYSELSQNDLLRLLTGQGYKFEEILEAGLCLENFNYPGQYFDRFRARIMFPIKDKDGNIEGFTGRTVIEQMYGRPISKYVNSSSSEVFDKSRAIFGIEKAVDNIKEYDEINIVEGQFDVISCHSNGYNNTVACSGTALTIEHLKILSEYTKNFIFCFDGDKAGNIATLKSIAKGAELGLNMRVLIMGEYQDPDDILKNGDKLFETVIDAEEFLVRKFIENRRFENTLEYLLHLKASDQDKFLTKLKNKCNEDNNLK